VIASGTSLFVGFKALGWTGLRTDLLFAAPLFAALGAVYQYRARWLSDEG
jgi:hypothetical protein